MSRELIAERLKNAMGLHAETVGMMTVSSAIDKRMRACNIETDAQYLSLIISSSSEIKELIETVIIPETWFFRENQPYEYVLNYINKNKHHSPINILSIPCSTGEEPYSIAMLLMDNNIHVDQFNIDAVDIGKNNINKARKACYRKNSFRADDLSFMDKYFHEEGKLFNLAGFVKNKVNFYCENVLSDSFDLGVSCYDVIFCRNLLIYFDEKTQNKMFTVIEKMLKPKGILILGHAETIQHSEDRFVSAINSKSYVYVKHDNLEESLPHIQKNRRRQVSQNTKRTVATKETKKPFLNTRKPAALGSSEPEVVDANEVNLELAFKLADDGKLDEALSLCNDFIASHIGSSKAHYLTGVIYDAKGDVSNADISLHKAIYLDPKNIEALIHLSLIAEQRGDHDQSVQFKNRAQRIKDRQSA